MTKPYICCPNRGCCYAKGGGTFKCSTCDKEYKKFVEESKQFASN